MTALRLGVHSVASGAMNFLKRQTQGTQRRYLAANVPPLSHEPRNS
jgi:hypothetical protein